MIGVDIVDLREARGRSDWRRKGYLSKLFSEKEIQYIEQSKDPDIAVWRLWSMKESAYKADFYYSRKRIFNPVKFNCHIQSDVEGKVNIVSRQYTTYTRTAKEYITTSASGNAIRGRCKSFRVPDKTDLSISEFTYSELKKEIASAYNKCPGEIGIHKTNQGVPEVFFHGHKTHILCSTSHHGKYGSVLFDYFGN